jgi:hypothetical protein
MEYPSSQQIPHGIAFASMVNVAVFSKLSCTVYQKTFVGDEPSDVDMLEEQLILVQAAADVRLGCSIVAFNIRISCLLGLSTPIYIMPFQIHL